MRSPIPHTLHATTTILMVLGALLLSACSDLTPLHALEAQPPEAEVADVRYDYVTAVSLRPRDTLADTEARYGGTVISWHPEEGFAVLGLRDGEASLRTLARSDANRNAMSAPEASAQGYTAWAGGYTAWAGGYTAWAGGYTAWAGGALNPFPGNEVVWDTIGLGGAQALASGLGLGVKVAVIDTGLDLGHDGFVGRLAPADEWADFVDGDALPQDDDPSGAAYGHGTAVAGVVLQAAPNATILPIRVLDSSGSGDVTSVIEAIDWAVEQGADVINLSLGTRSNVRALQWQVGYAMRQGVTVVSSAGNTGNTSVTFPAHNAVHPRFGRRALGVGSVDASGVKSPFSNHGRRLEMVAPGEGVITLYPGNQVTSATGTSFAAPWVSGAVALALGEGASGAGVAGDVTSTAVSVDTVNRGYDLGHGRLDSHGLMRRVLGL